MCWRLRASSTVTVSPSATATTRPSITAADAGTASNTHTPNATHFKTPTATAPTTQTGADHSRNPAPAPCRLAAQRPRPEAMSIKNRAPHMRFGRYCHRSMHFT